MSSTELISALEKYSSGAARVVPFDPNKDKLVRLDLTKDNKDLPESILNDTKAFTDYINHLLENKGARYAVGGYNEHRTIYSASRVFDGSTPGEEPRRLHLGIDIWGKPNTAVMAPWNGIVHSFAMNDQMGDYGPTIILSHQIDGLSFHTLYGHLSLNSIKNLEGGERVMKGDVFAEFGIPAENGRWPPHLHFQVINDLEGWSGDYPGVCKYSEREKYLTNCPDPDLILQMNQYLS